ncbi:MAG: GDP-L-fucose synthase [Acidobacteria bacterium]|uniref:GDP-L-fucose synthase n=1 Tax=Candidatus Polarisedimenticola svalbardensis TaxID=2886004 RepID=A0A8J7C1Q5_9BACT|nr:GDP-L-fucose synthase [Candidatus Polarisedimenticola svalbardensis]
MDPEARIFLAGHQGMVGAAILRRLEADGYSRLIVKSRGELDLTDQQVVRRFFDDEKPDQVILAAARVGGIGANIRFPADFIYQNLMIEANVIHEAFRSGVRRLLFLGSSCIYPRDASQPMTEDALLAGPLEPTNESYAVAKVAGIKLCEAYNLQHGTDFRSVMPTNLYGPNDNYDPDYSHVVPALIRRFHEARIAGDPAVTVWGSGEPQREFLHVDDMAAAALHVMNLAPETWAAATRPRLSHINVGSGEEVTIREMAELVKAAVGYAGELRFDHTRPDGVPRKALDGSLLRRLGWQPSWKLPAGLAAAYRNYLEKLDG